MNYKPVFHKIFIRASNSGGLHKKTLENGASLFIKTETPIYETRYSEVIGVSPDIDFVKEGEWIYHHQNATQDNFKIDETTYIVTPDMAYGTKERMFFDNIFMTPVFHEREIVIGSASNAKIVKEKVLSMNQVDVTTGEHKGKRMYCADIVHHNMGGLGAMFYRTISSLLFADQDMNPCKGVTLIRRIEKDFVEYGGLILRKKDFRLKQHLQYGEVFRSNEYKEGQLCLFSPYRQIETERGIFDVVRDGGVALTYDKQTKVILR